MIVKGKVLDQMLERPSHNFRAILFYGPNEGRIREYAMRVTQTIVPDLSDPFRICQLTAADLDNDPALLTDEAAAIAMTGGRRVVRVRGVGDSQTDGFINFLEDPQGDGLIVVEAGELSKTSRLRKLFEASTVCAIAACYEESATDLEELVTGHLRRNGLTINSDAKAYLLQSLGEDRLASRQELDKLVLYKWPHRTLSHAARVIDGTDTMERIAVIDTVDTADILDIRDIAAGFDGGGVLDVRDTHGVIDIHDTGDIQDIGDTGDGHGMQDTLDSSGAYSPARARGAKDSHDTYDTYAGNDRCVSLEDVLACIGDNSIQGLDSISNAMAEGDLATLDNHLARSFEAGMAPVAVLRAASNHLLRLHLAAAVLAQGNSVDMVLRSLKPPVHFSRTNSFRLQLRIWSLPRLARALELLLQAEAACKTSGAPDQSLCSHALLQVALLVRRNP